MDFSRRLALATATVIAFSGNVAAATTTASNETTTAMPTALCGRATPKHPQPTHIARRHGHRVLHVATYNILHGLTAEGDRTLEARLRIKIRRLAATPLDIVGLEEVSESGKHGRVITRLARGIARRTHERWYWCWFRTEPHAPHGPDTRPGGGDPASDELAAHYNSNDHPWYEGAAVVTRWPILDSAVRRLPGEDANQRLHTDCTPPFTDPTCLIDIGLEPRAALWTQVSTPFGPVSFTVAHTSGNVAQHRALANFTRRRSAPDRTALLVCDCNSLPSDSAQHVIRAAGWLDTFRHLHGHGGPTADQRIGTRAPTVRDRIDYVFLRAGSGLHLVASHRFMNRPARSRAEKSGWLWPSDHWGVIATLR
jgi:endonuclease/exonuclease/phosphatase family metal-dependent hydrolase